jgi:site-specific recombinase XerD
MKPFESFLAPRLNDYLTYREGLGYAPRPCYDHLRLFDRYVHQTGADLGSLHPSFFLHMRTTLAMQASSVNHVLSVTRGFFRFLVRRGTFEKNPLLDIPPLKEEITVPFIFSPEQTDQILKAICKTMQRGQASFLKELAMYMAILLMARCGMRISEPLHLLKHHYRSEEGTLYIEKTKFRKDRLIPLPKAVMQEMENYLSVRAHLRPQDQNPYLLAGKDLNPLPDQQVRFFFHHAVRAIGITQPRKKLGNLIFTPPTPHCLRHSFAVNTLKAIKERGASPQYALPVLATYLGHATYFNTSVYLKVADASSCKNLYEFSLWQKGKL